MNGIIIYRDSGITVWDSEDQLGIEYSRSCAENGRNQSHLWHRCIDPIHHGITYSTFLKNDFFFKYYFIYL